MEDFWRSQFLSFLLDSEASREKVRNPKRTHPPGHHLRILLYLSGFLLKGKTVRREMELMCFLIEVAGKVSLPEVGRDQSKLLLSMGHEPIGMFFSVVKSSEEIPEVLHL